MQDFGRWLALMQLDCSQKQPDQNSKYYNLQHERNIYFSEELAAYTVLEPLIERLNSVGNNDERKPFCQKIAMLLKHIDS